MKKLILLTCSIMMSFSAYAVDVPSSAEAKKVLDYYYNGQGQGVVLIESKLCSEIDKEGDNKNNCADNINPVSVQKGQNLNLWMAFLVPNNDPVQNIIIQFEHNGIARMVKDVKVSGSVRYRTWRKVSFSKTGNWTVKIIHDKGDDVQLLDTLSITVSEASTESTEAAVPTAQ
ncbi:MAG: hypothetical protein KAT06_12365 [Gammaproteobacteria bacterium]|nr:hypothetical protein [Gammaproteobacteria bacterium]